MEKYEVYAASKPIVKIVDEPASREDSANAYAALLEADEKAAESYEGPDEYEIDGITFTSESDPREVADAYYRWFDRTNKEAWEKDEKKIRRRKIV